VVIDPFGIGAAITHFYRKRHFLVLDKYFSLVAAAVTYGIGR
jgi:hypothetical protein